MKDPYILAKALAYAIVAIEGRPETIREQADYNDMVLLFRKLPASEREMFLDEARRDLTSHHECGSLDHPRQTPANEATGHAPEIAAMKFAQVEA
jgi:hypothetical protein